MQISINLASKPFADLGPILKRLRIVMGVFALVAIGLGIGLHALHHKAEQARARNHSLDGSIAQLNHERQGYEAMMRQPDNAAVLAQTNNLNHLFDEKAFSWTLAMEDLETVLPAGVQVTTLEPLRDKQGQITLHLRVLGPRDRAVELVQNLEHSRRFRQPRIVNESAEGSNTPGRQMEPVSASNRVNFDVLAEYNPATPAERKATHQKKEAAASASAQPETPRALTPHAGPGMRRPPYTGPNKSMPAMPHASGGGPR